MRLTTLLAIASLVILQSCSTKPRIVKSPCSSLAPGEPCEKRAVNDWLRF